MLVGVKIKQPADILDYDFIYTEWFGVSGDTIDTVQVDVTPALGMTATPALPSADIVKVLCAGGNDGEIFKVEVTVTTVAGLVKQDELEVRIQEF